MKPIPIVYEDDDILIVNKQSGMAVQGGKGILNALDTVLSDQMGQKIYLVHRLDQDTAGLLVTAKNPAAAARYTKLFGNSSIKKEYVALCFGIPKNECGTIDENLTQHGDVKSARTLYRVLKATQKAACTTAEEAVYEFSLLSLSLATGRMHQIRKHLQVIDTPIVADDKYGDFKANKAVKKAFGIKKLQLASVRLELPVGGKHAVFEAELPPHMQDACAVLF